MDSFAFVSRFRQFDYRHFYHYTKSIGNLQYKSVIFLGIFSVFAFSKNFFCGGGKIRTFTGLFMANLLHPTGLPCYAYHYITTSVFLSTWLDSNQRNEVLQTPALDHSTTGAFLFILKPLQDSNLCFFASRNVAS